jgi:hypothetical protein
MRNDAVASRTIRIQEGNYRPCRFLVNPGMTGIGAGTDILVPWARISSILQFAVSQLSLTLIAT